MTVKSFIQAMVQETQSLILTTTIFTLMDLPKFENIKIVSTTTATGKFLDTDGNPLVMGEGITTDAPKNIPLRIGVSGYSTVGDREAPVDVEIYSGQYNTIDVGAYYIEAGNEANNKTPGGTITVNGGIITSINFMSDGMA